MCVCVCVCVWRQYIRGDGRQWHNNLNKNKASFLSDYHNNYSKLNSLLKYFVNKIEMTRFRC